MNNTRSRSILPCTLLMLAVAIIGRSPLLQADHRTLWELGAGAATLHAPLYRGSKITKDYSIPIPFVRYRGKIFAADEDGMRGKLYKTNHFEMDVSFAGSLPVPKDRGGAREDMPSLDPIIQFGPALKYFLSKSVSNNGKRVVTLKLPLRMAMSVGNPVLEHQGWAMSPNLNWLEQFRNKGANWRVSISVGPLFADAKYHNYFYQVDQKYETGQRLPYSAGGGYSGSRLSIRISRNTKKLYLGLFARFDDLSNAKFVDSPLVETERYGVYGVAIAWVFRTSEQRARHSNGEKK